MGGGLSPCSKCVKRDDDISSRMITNKLARHGYKQTILKKTDILTFRPRLQKEIKTVREQNIEHCI